MGAKRKVRRRNNPRKKHNLPVQQRDNNSQSRKDRSDSAKPVFKSLLERTIMKEVGLEKVDPELILAILTLGIITIKAFQIENLPGAKPFIGKIDEMFRRAGLCWDEYKAVNKVACSKASLSHALDIKRRKNPFIQREDTDKTQCYIYLDGLGDVVLLRIANAFTPDELKARTTFMETHAHFGWSKGCSLSGHINEEQAFIRFLNNPVARRAYFGRHWREYTLLGIEVTKEGKGTTAKLHYFNRNGKHKKMQFGNYIKRDVHNESVLRGNRYHETAGSYLVTLGPYLHDPKNYLKNETKRLAAGLEMKMAINSWENGTDAPPSWHSDGTVHAACLASAMPSHKSLFLDSNSKLNSDAGALCLEFGGYIHPYGHQDALIFNGEHLHGPLCPAPDSSYCEAVKNGGKKGVIGRHSFITFLK